MSNTRKPTSRPSRDVYQEVTDSIVAALEAGGSTFTVPWTTSAASMNPISNSTRKPYRGMNTILLWIAAYEKGYTSNVWGTYKSWFKVDADGNATRHVRKGEKGTTVIFWKQVDRKATAEEIAEGKADKHGKMKSLLLRAYTVFNAEQVEGYVGPAKPEPAADTPTPIDAAEKFFAAIGADVRVTPGYAGASYSKHSDQITIEHLDNFVSAERYYTTLSHEHGHWTGHESRLDRKLGNRFGSEEYAAEELIAELTAAFVDVHLGITPELRDDHAAYIASWIKVLRNDKRAIFTAASQAQRAADFLFAAAGVDAENEDETVEVAA